MIPDHLLTFCQVFGAFPFRYKTTPNGNKVVEYSPAVFVWGLVMTATQLLLSVLVICVDYTARDNGTIRMTSSTSVMVVCFDLGSLNFLGIAIVVSCGRKHQEFIELSNILERVDDMMQSVVPRPKALLKAVLTFTGMAFALGISIHIDNSHWVSLERKNPTIYNPIYSNYCVQIAMLIHFGYVTRNISRRFCEVNERMKRILMKNTYGQRRRRDWISNFDPNLGELIFDFYIILWLIQEFLWNKLVSRSGHKIQQLYMKLCVQKVPAPFVS